MSNVSQFLGGGGQAAGTAFISRLFTKSTVVPIPKSGRCRVIGVGPGGSGAVRVGAGAGVTGGAAGAFGIAEFDVAAGENISVVIGAPGLGVEQSSAGGAKNGLNGGTTTVTHNGVTRTLNGGQGGRSDGVGAVGGTASGWDVNSQGGGSGNAGADNTATGGGAVNVFNTSPALCSSGSVTSSGVDRATGGASPGGKSGDVSSTSQNACSAGAGTGGPSDDVTSGATTGLPGGPDVFGGTVSGITAPVDPPPVAGFILESAPLIVIGGGSPNATGSTPVNLTSPSAADSTGGGSGASCGVASSGSSKSGDSGSFAGTGGATTSFAALAETGAPGYGAGSGAASARGTGATAKAKSASGGDSFVLIEVF